MLRHSLLIILWASTFLAATAADPKTEAREALWAAVRAADTKAIAVALDKGADVNAKNEYGITALWIAASKGKTEVIEFLLARGADPTARDGIWYQTPLSQSLDKLENVKVFLKAGAKDIDAAATNAAVRGKLDVLQAILDTGKVSQERLDAALFAIGETKKEIREASSKAETGCALDGGAPVGSFSSRKRKSGDTNTSPIAMPMDWSKSCFKRAFL